MVLVHVDRVWLRVVTVSGGSMKIASTTSSTAEQVVAVMLALLSCEWEAVEPAKLPDAACNEVLVTPSTGRLQIAVALACSTNMPAGAQVTQ